MSRILMCQPDYYGIEYEINPWMNIRRKTDHEKAVHQWKALYEILTSKMGAAVELLKPVRGLPDMVFTANAGVPSDGKFILSNFRYQQRQGEAPHFEQWFRQKGYEVVKLPGYIAFEGCGDILPFDQKLVGGWKFRSDRLSHERISEILNQEVVSLELADPRFYHLDTCFCPLGNGAAIYYPDAFDYHSRKMLEITVARPILLSPEEAILFGANAVVVDKKIVFNTGCANLRKKLEQEGFEVYETDLSEFLKSGGAAKCLTLEISS